METIYSRLLRLHAENIIKRGRNKGYAHNPEYPRSTHDFIVIPYSGAVAVRMHHTNIIRVTEAEPDVVTLDTGGWHDSTTTRERLYTAGRVLAPNYEMRLRLWTENNNSLRTTRIATHAGNQGAYYDGMKIARSGTVISPRMAVFKYVADREARRAFAADHKDFKNALKLLANLDRPPEGFAAAAVMWRWKNSTHKAERLRAAVADTAMWPHLAYEYKVWPAFYSAATADMVLKVEVA